MENERYHPRYECGLPMGAVSHCYIYEPVKPLVLAKAKWERRPFPAGAAFAGRVLATGVAKCELAITRKGRKVVLWQKPTE